MHFAILRIITCIHFSVLAHLQQGLFQRSKPISNAKVKFAECSSFPGISATMSSAICDKIPRNCSSTCRCPLRMVSIFRGKKRIKCISYPYSEKHMMYCYRLTSLNFRRHHKYIPTGYFLELLQEVVLFPR